MYAIWIVSFFLNGHMTWQDGRDQKILELWKFGLKIRWLEIFLSNNVVVDITLSPSTYVHLECKLTWGDLYFCKGLVQLLTS